MAKPRGEAPLAPAAGGSDSARGIAALERLGVSIEALVRLAADGRARAGLDRPLGPGRGATVRTFAAAMEVADRHVHAHLEALQSAR